MSNRNFGKIVDGRLEFAPNALTLSDCVILNPSEEQYKEYGYLPVMPSAANPESGYHVSSVSYDVMNGAIVTNYSYEQDEQPEKRYSKYRIGVAVQEAGLLDSLLGFFSENQSYKFHWDNAQDFGERDEIFMQIKAKLADAFGADAVNAILAKSEI